MPQNKRLQVRHDWNPDWPRPGIPLFSGLFDRCKIGVVCTAGALRGRVRVALICIMRRAAGDFLNDLTYYAYRRYRALGARLPFDIDEALAAILDVPVNEAVAHASRFRIANRDDAHELVVVLVPNQISEPPAKPI
jgi:hypothetical protein